MSCISWMMTFKMKLMALDKKKVIESDEEGGPMIITSTAELIYYKT